MRSPSKRRLRRLVDNGLERVPGDRYAQRVLGVGLGRTYGVGDRANDDVGFG